MKKHFLATFTTCCLISISGAYADQLYVLNGGSNNVSVIDTFSNKVTALIPVGIQPSAIALAPNIQVLYVANTHDNTVDAINTVTHQKTTISVGSHPVGLFISPDESHVYVLSEGTTSIGVINTNTQKLGKTIPIGAEPFFAAMAHQGSKLYVICYASHIISVIDTTTAALVDTISIGPTGTNPTGIAVFSPPNNAAAEVIYVTVPNPQSNYSNGSFIAIEAASHKIVRTIPVEPVPSSVTIAPTNTQAVVINGVYSHNIDLINTTTYGLSSFPVGSRASYAIFSPNDTLYISNAASNTVTAIDTQIHAVINTIQVGNWPLGGTIDANGMLYICNNTDNTVSVINTHTNTVVNTITVGTGPSLIVP